MAPSPTGEYHIGHIRTLLYNYAFAKKNQGQFIVRIEDTDRGRYVEGSVDRILEVITQYGFTWDEGPGVGGPFAPYIQSERLSLYEKYAEELVKNGHAYYCFCSEERLEKLREEQRAQHLPTTKYDRLCLKLSPEEVKEKLKTGEKHVIRLKVPDNREIRFKDEVLGEVKINSNDIDDQVLLKNDGYPTYHLAAAVDDHLMEITHVMRGIDWLPSTPKYVLLYEAFGWELPVYIHLPNLKELGGTKKLSKRFGSVAAIEFLQEGYLPEALVNFFMFLGWNPGGEQEIYSLNEFIEKFSLEKIHKTDLVAFDRQKLLWMNGHYIRNMDIENLYGILTKWAEKFGTRLNGEKSKKEFNLKVLSLVKDRMKKLGDYNLLTEYFYKFSPPDKNTLSGFTKNPEKAKEILNSFLSAYQKTGEEKWNVNDLENVNHLILDAQGYSPKEAFMTLRVAVTASSATPTLVDVLELLGKKEVLQRIETSLKLYSL